MLLSLITLIVVTVAGSPESPRIVARGASVDDVPISEPTAFADLGDGRFAIYGRKDCRIHVVDHSLSDLVTFGRCGEGPGDVSDARGLFYYDDEIWVALRGRMSRFADDGTYLGDLELQSTDFDAAALVANHFVGAAHRDVPTFFAIDLAESAASASPLALDRPFTTPTTDTFHAFGSSDESAYFYGDQSGEIVIVLPASGTARRVDLGLRPADVDTETSSSGEVSSWRAPILTAWVEGPGIIHLITAIDNPPPGADAIARYRETGELPGTHVRRYELERNTYDSYEFVRLHGIPSSVHRLTDGTWAVLDRWNAMVWTTHSLRDSE